DDVLITINVGYDKWDRCSNESGVGREFLTCGKLIPGAIYRYAIEVNHNNTILHTLEGNRLNICNNPNLNILSNKTLAKNFHDCFCVHEHRWMTLLNQFIFSSYLEPIAFALRNRHSVFSP